MNPNIESMNLSIGSRTNLSQLIPESKSEKRTGMATDSKGCNSSEESESQECEESQRELEVEYEP